MPAELNVSISDGLMTKLTSLASDTQRSREELVAAAVERLVDDDGPWIGKLLGRMREADSGMSVPHEEVVAWSESLGTANPLPRPLARKRAS
jgi:predicted transcriptional regulator